MLDSRRSVPCQVLTICDHACQELAGDHQPSQHAKQTCDPSGVSVLPVQHWEHARMTNFPLASTVDPSIAVLYLGSSHFPKGLLPVASSGTQRLISEVRGVRYGEVIAVFLRDSGFEAEVFGTQTLNQCPQELWDTLDADAIAAEMGAFGVKLNGPRYWMIDGIGQKTAVVDPVTRDFNGLTMRRIAVINLGDNPTVSPYTEAHVNRGAVFFFDAGSPVYELVNSEGLAYVMQAYCVGVDPTITQESLETLGQRLMMPLGWSYQSRILEEELVVDTAQSIATVLQDEFENSYTLPE